MRNPRPLSWQAAAHACMDNARKHERCMGCAGLQHMRASTSCGGSEHLGSSFVSIRPIRTHRPLTHNQQRGVWPHLHAAHAELCTAQICGTPATHPQSAVQYRAASARCAAGRHARAAAAAGTAGSAGSEGAIEGWIVGIGNEQHERGAMQTCGSCAGTCCLQCNLTCTGLSKLMRAAPTGAVASRIKRGSLGPCLQHLRKALNGPRGRLVGGRGKTEHARRIPRLQRLELRMAHSLGAPARLRLQGRAVK